ncbi:hypothetical protein UPM260_3224 [Salmonella enterica subsp. enterica serovar Typhimurium]|nr:hypothetical protein UPM260_3224 [Salmonella enterica subsp. enterica serovar Typhimurium]
MKNQQTEKKIQKTLVQKNGIPIMRLHELPGIKFSVLIWLSW